MTKVFIVKDLLLLVAVAKAAVAAAAVAATSKVFRCMPF